MNGLIIEQIFNYVKPIDHNDDYNDDQNDGHDDDHYDRYKKV